MRAKCGHDQIRLTRPRQVTPSDLHANTKALLVKPQFGLRVEVMRGELNVRVTRVKHRPLTVLRPIFRASSIRSASK